MSDHDSDLLAALRAELAFLEQGGYGRSVRTPWKATELFRDSPTCLNFNDPERPHPCSECMLMQFVPKAQQDTDMPCHHIPLDVQGQTVDSMERWETQAEMEDALASWLKRTIRQIELKAVKDVLATGT